MSACEKCWADANTRAFFLGGSVSDHYRDLLHERRDTPCSPSQQAGVVDAVAPSVEGSDVNHRAASSSSSLNNGASEAGETGREP